MKRGPGFKLNLNSQPTSPTAASSQQSAPNSSDLTSNFTRFVDPSGRLNFEGKAIVHANGVDFGSGKSYRIGLSDLATQEELGRGTFGTVNKVVHKTTGAVMAMKQIRIEISNSAFRQMVMELEVLHRSQSPFIVEFYGAFFTEGSVYYCMEYMDAGSLEKMYGEGLSEPVLARVALDVVSGLNFLKDTLSVIHRDVKPTNILVNSRGNIKLCDFGVSGQLVQSMAKTNIGCQSYMAPERITFADATYSVASDVWSFGVTLWEAAMGRHPFMTETYDSVFAQMTAIIEEEMPVLDPKKFSEVCQDFINGCLAKKPEHRPNYHAMLKHPFIEDNKKIPIDMEAWAKEACERNARIKAEKELKA